MLDIACTAVCGALPDCQLPGDYWVAPEPRRPRISSLNPDHAKTTTGPDFVLHVLGANFDASSVIVFNDGDEPTTFVTASELTTTVKPSLASGPITVPVQVRTGTELTNVANFTFT